MLRTTDRPPPPGMWTSTSTTVGTLEANVVDGLIDVGRRADDLEVLLELGADAAEEELMIVDEEDANGVGHGCSAFIDR